jgi:DNA-binding transcriptional ArsR family regulator
VSRVCTICSHPARENIDSAIVHRVPYRDISRRFGVSDKALSRHLHEHLAEYVRQALSKYGEQKGIKVLDKLGNIVERLEAFLDKAEDTEDGLGFRATAAELRKQLELIAKLQGELQQEGTTNITLNPEYLELRSAILVALEPHPDAAESVSRAMLELENGKG